MSAMIDAHHHLWDLEAVHYPWLMSPERRFFGDPAPIRRNYLFDEFHAEASAAGMAGSVHVQVGAADPLAEARWVQSVADAHPEWPLAQVVFADLTADDPGAVLDAYAPLGTVRGVRQIVGRSAREDAATGTNALLDDPRFAAGLRELGRRGLSFDLQLVPPVMARTAAVLAEAPGTAVALCHCGSPADQSAAGLRDWRAGLAALAALPQVHCKLSGLGMFDAGWTTDSIRPIVMACVEAFGPERVMFGSNFPVDKLYADYARVVRACREILPATIHDAALGGNAARFYRLAANGARP